MTVYEQLAKAFPLHFQRIVEIASISNSYGWQRFVKDAPAFAEPGAALSAAFIWVWTDEGVGYWNALAVGADAQ